MEQSIGRHALRTQSCWNVRRVGGAENDGPSKLQGVKMQDMKMQDMKSQDKKLQDMTNISILLLYQSQ